MSVFSLIRNFFAVIGIISTALTVYLITLLIIDDKKQREKEGKKMMKNENNINEVA